MCQKYHKVNSKAFSIDKNARDREVRVTEKTVEVEFREEG